MIKIVFSLYLFIVSGILYAQEENANIEVTAKHLDSTNTTVTGTDGVVVYYNDAVIKADSAMYNRETKILVLDGKIEMIGYRGTKEHTDHMEIDTQHDEIDFKQLFLATQNDIWMITDKAHKSEGNYTLGNTVLSSCDANDPLWTMAFTSSKYDVNDSYMKVYNAKVYFKDVPVFYSPYMGFSTNKKRSSGLLFPSLGYSNNEGFVYEQPIFWAISESMDLELNPQIRTNRSKGMYGTFRFVDSDHSSGTLRLGYFKDKIDYVKKFNLLEDKHYGLEFNYESSQVFSGMLSKEYVDGLYINSTLLNDIDYINLQNTTLQHFGETPLQESRFNYFLYNNDYYTGLTAKYFIDTRQNINDDETLQILPALQFHKYLDHIFWQNLTYSADLQLNNFDRKEGTTLKQVEMRVPLEFTTSFFDDFLNLSLGEEIYYTKLFFGNEKHLHDDFQYYSNLHKVKVFTDLTKRYSNFVHILQPSLAYIYPGQESQKPVDSESLEPQQKDLFSVGLPEEHYLFKLSQYFYDDEMHLKFFQRLSQNYYVNNSLDRNYKLVDLTNEMQYNIGKWQFYNNMVYSHEFGDIRESSSRISFYETEYNFSLNHAYKQVLPDQITQSILPANDMIFNFGYIYNDRVSFNGAVTYNIDESSSKQWRIGGSYKQDCWSVVASVNQVITPRPTGETLDNTFFVQFNFIPFGSIGTGE